MQKKNVGIRFSSNKIKIHCVLQKIDSTVLIYSINVIDIGLTHFHPQYGKHKKISEKHSLN
jgi:hypothetical protein